MAHLRFLIHICDNREDDLLLVAKNLFLFVPSSFKLSSEKFTTEILEVISILFSTKSVSKNTAALMQPEFFVGVLVSN